MATVKQKQQAKKRSVAKKTHDVKTKERANQVIDLKVAYGQKDAQVVVADILEKAKKFISYHNKIAQDGVGARKTGFKTANDQDEVETVYLTNDQRAGHLDKSAGIQELVDYIERMETPVSNELAAKAK